MIAIFLSSRLPKKQILVKTPSKGSKCKNPFLLDRGRGTKTSCKDTPQRLPTQKSSAKLGLILPVGGAGPPSVQQKCRVYFHVDQKMYKSIFT